MLIGVCVFVNTAWCIVNGDWHGNHSFQTISFVNRWCVPGLWFDFDWLRNTKERKSLPHAVLLIIGLVSRTLVGGCVGSHGGRNP